HGCCLDRRTRISPGGSGSHSGRFSTGRRMRLVAGSTLALGWRAHGTGAGAWDCGSMVMAASSVLGDAAPGVRRARVAGRGEVADHHADLRLDRVGPPEVA